VRTMKAVKDEMKDSIVKAQTRVAIIGRELDVEVLFACDEGADHVDGTMKGKSSVGHCAAIYLVDSGIFNVEPDNGQHSHG